MHTKTSLSFAAALLLVPAGHAFAQTSGTSHPEALDDSISTAQPSDDSHYVKPSHDVPSTTETVIASAPALHPHAAPGTAETYHPYNNAAVTEDVNSGIVTDVPVGPNELPIGTTLKATLQTDISTRDTVAGTHFTAVLASDIGRDGKVFLPAGTLVHGRVTQIHGGRRISGAAAIRLQPENVTLPDGTVYHVDAEVTDLDHFQDSHVNGEGAIVSNAHGTATAAILGATTATAVIAGALIGGGVGAVVGLGVGAGVSTVWWLKQDRQQTLLSGTDIVFCLNESLQLIPSLRN
jgi:hypothetical protein